MFCPNCGENNLNEAAFCVKCGTALNQTNAVNLSDGAVDSQQMVISDTFASKILSVFQDQLFLIICILISVSAGLSLITRNLAVSDSVFAILFTIFLWLIFADMKKGIVKGKYMRCVSGIVYAQYVCIWVACGLLAILALVIIFGQSILSATGLFDEIVSKLVSVEDFRYSEVLIGSLGILIGIVILVIGALLALFNILGTRSIHMFAKSLYMSVDNKCNNILNAKRAHTWLLVFGICIGLSAVSSISEFSDFIIHGCKAAAYIIAYILIKKHFVD